MITNLFLLLIIAVATLDNNQLPIRTGTPTPTQVLCSCTWAPTNGHLTISSSIRSCPIISKVTLCVLTPQ